MAVSETSTRGNHTGSWKYIRPLYQDRVAPCNAGCPVGIDIEGYMNLLRQDRVTVRSDDEVSEEDPVRWRLRSSGEIRYLRGSVDSRPSQLTSKRETTT